jgi:hypothetical protein
LSAAKKKKTKATDSSSEEEDISLTFEKVESSPALSEAELDLNKTIQVLSTTQGVYNTETKAEDEDDAAGTQERDETTVKQEEDEVEEEKEEKAKANDEQIRVETLVSDQQATFISALDSGDTVSDNNNIHSTQQTSQSSTLSDEQRELISYLQTLGAITGRGEFSSPKQKASAMSTLEKLERMNPTLNTTMSTMMNGRWELVYSTTQLFRSSPLFMAGRSVCTTEQQAKQYNWFCDMHRKALAMSTIVGVRQIVSDDKLVSEFEVKAGTIPFLSDFTPFRYSGGLPFSIDGAIVSTADLTRLGDAWSLYMDTVEIKGSNVPALRQLLDGGIKLQSRALGDFLEERIDYYNNPRPCFRTTYLNDQFRISRDEDDHVFFYVKTSNQTDPTDYSRIDADLGVGRLLEGFNDAVTRLYL